MLSLYDGYADDLLQDLRRIAAAYEDLYAIRCQPPDDIRGIELRGLDDDASEPASLQVLLEFERKRA